MDDLKKEILILKQRKQYIQNNYFIDGECVDEEKERIYVFLDDLIKRLENIVAKNKI